MGLFVTTALLGAAAFVLPWLWDNVVIVGRRLWATKDIPEPPASLWLGHIPALLGSRYKSFRCFHAWGLKWPIYRVRFFWRPVSNLGSGSSSCSCFARQLHLPAWHAMPCSSSAVAVSVSTVGAVNHCSKQPVVLLGCPHASLGCMPMQMRPDCYSPSCRPTAYTADGLLTCHMHAAGGSH